MPSDYAFDRPIIIVSAPRSGSTLLFETMSRAKSVWTIGGESHGVFEGIDKLNPRFGRCSSNRLTADNADSETVARIRRTFLGKLRNSAGRSFEQGQERPRFLEKTPKNSLRIPFLNEVFPDALYVYLYRDPRENLSSIIEAWRSGDFVTYPKLPGWPGTWSLLLPEGYEGLRDSSLEEVAAFQWRSANESILNDLGALGDDRWTAVSYAELVTDPAAVLERLCAFADIPFDANLRAHCEAALPLSRHTRTAPRAGKWRINGAMVERVLPGLRRVVERMQAAVVQYTSAPVLVTTPADAAPGRNDPCPCGSGLRFKHCHGKLAQSDSSPLGMES